MNLFNSVMNKRPKLNKFDLSHEKKLSLPMGALVPVFYQEVLPGDKIRVSTEVLLRLAPMLAPVMHRMNVFIHYFFVPNRLVWEEWEPFITGGPNGTSNPVYPYATCNTTNVTKFHHGSLYDYFGFPTLDPSVGLVTNPTNVSALLGRAYSLIYNEYYRDQDLEDPIEIALGSGDNNGNMDVFDLRYRSWEKDYFTSARPWAQKGPDVLMPFDAEVTYRDPALAIRTAGPNATGPLSADGVNDGQIEDNTGAPVRIENIESISNGTTTINELRLAVKLQEFYEKMARGGSRYAEQMLSMFGVVSDDARLQRPEYLGGGKQAVQISEVLSTFQTEAEGLPQGNMSGRGISIGKMNQFSRRFKEHGQVMGIMSVLPRTGYMNGIPKYMQRFDRFEHAFPVFGNLGEQEIKLSELWYDPAGPAAELTETFGYQSRYAEYKYQPSTVHADMRDSLIHWHMNRDFETKPELNQGFTSAQYATTRIFAAEGATQQFLWCQLYNKVDALRPLPYFGTPQL